MASRFGTMASTVRADAISCQLDNIIDDFILQILLAFMIDMFCVMATCMDRWV